MYFLATLMIAACKTQEPVPVANFYKPIFDQTGRTYISTASNQVNLDTMVLIRSNLLEVDEVLQDTFFIDNEFFITDGELLVDVELINEKPPVYDTFLYVTAYLFASKYVNTAFPVLPDSILYRFEEVIDSIAPDSLSLVGSMDFAGDTLQSEEKDTLSAQITEPLKQPQVRKKDVKRFVPGFLLSKEERKARKTRREIDKNISLSIEREQLAESLPENQDTIGDAFLDDDQVMNDSITLVDTLPAVPEKLWFSRDEILADSTRDLLDANTILDALIDDAVWPIGDSIPIYQLSTNYFLDSSLMMLYDTLLVEVFDSSRIIPQLPFEKLIKENHDTIIDRYRYVIQEVIRFKIFHPEIDDVYVPMVRVSGGTFKIGSNEYDEDERPAYQITVSNYLIGKYEVTNKLFCYFLNDMFCDSLGYINEIKVIDLFHPLTRIRQDPITKKFFTTGGYEDFPVVNVSWIGAQMYCKMAGGELPSEAQWEYAAKGGAFAKRYYTNREQTDYAYVNLYAGGQYMSDVGWFVDNSYGRVNSIGKLRPNELGIYDMSGNVWEWCYDQYSADFYRRNGKSRNPVCLDGGTSRVNRGGSWSNDAMYCRITNRNFLNQYRYNEFLGFRFMRDWR